jgi:hypothetical protein
MTHHSVVPFASERELWGVSQACLPPYSRKFSNVLTYARLHQLDATASRSGSAYEPVFTPPAMADASACYRLLPCASRLFDDFSNSCSQVVSYVSSAGGYVCTGTSDNTICLQIATANGASVGTDTTVQSFVATIGISSTDATASVNAAGSVIFSGGLTQLNVTTTWAPGAPTAARYLAFASPLVRPHHLWYVHMHAAVPVEHLVFIHFTYRVRPCC